jgi:succinate dehydrogenase/fumarate reductase flavoprotein subunit
MDRYSPTVNDLAPRDMFARTMLDEVREGCGPDGAYVVLDMPHPEPAHIDAKAARHHPSPLAWRRAVNRADPVFPTAR